MPDPRDARRRRYPLAGLLAIAILATAAGMRGYAGFATWAATAPPEMLARLGIQLRRPSEKTFPSVRSRLDPADLDRRLGVYFTGLAAAQTRLARIQALPWSQVSVAYCQPRRHLLNATPWRTEMDDRSAVCRQITTLDTAA